MALPMKQGGEDLQGTFCFRHDDLELAVEHQEGLCIGVGMLAHESSEERMSSAGRRWQRAVPSLRGWHGEERRDGLLAEIQQARDTGGMGQAAASEVLEGCSGLRRLLHPPSQCIHQESAGLGGLGGLLQPQWFCGCMWRREMAQPWEGLHPKDHKGAGSSLCLVSVWDEARLCSTAMLGVVGEWRWSWGWGRDGI